MQHIFFRPSLLVALLALGGAALAAQPARADYYIGNDEVTIDNFVTEDEGWGDPLIDDGEDDPSREQFCFNTDAAAWVSTTDPASCTTVLYDEGGQLDIETAWIGFNETHMLMAYQSVAPMYSLTDADGSFISLYDSNTLASRGVTSIPNDFSHDFVFSFDQNPVAGEESFDWYLVAHINFSFGSGVGPGSNSSFFQLYAEEGTTAGYQADEDVVASDISLADAETATITDPSQIDSIFELKANLELFYELTGFSVGDDVGFRLETHSVTGDETPTEIVEFVNTAVTEDAIVVGNGARQFDGRFADAYPKGIFRIYADSDQSELLEVTAYDKNYGVQVAVGDVDADGELEVVTLPFKAMKNPMWKVFNLNGELEASGSVPKKAGERLTNYHLAVGNLDNSDKEEIVFSNAKGSGVLLDVFRLTDEGELSRVAQYKNREYEGYTVGSWVKIANVDTSTDADEIVTASFKGGAQVDLWNLDESSVNLTASYLEIDAPEDYSKGLHIAPAEGGVWISTHGPKARAVWHEWVESKGNLNPTDNKFLAGLVGDVVADTNAVWTSRFDKKQVVKVKNSGTLEYRLSTQSKGSFLDLIDL